MVDWHRHLGLRDEKLEPAIARLVAEAGLEGDFSLYPVAGGANNKIFRLEVGAAEALLKVYFQHPDDPRDRLGAEFSFSRFAWENGVRSLPRPFACDPHKRIGLYEFVQGRRLMPHEVTEGVVRQALSFYCELNRHKRLPSAGALPRASEACFTIAEHLQCVEERLRNLRNVDESSAINREAVAFIQNELSEVWTAVADAVRKQASELRLALVTEIARHDRCLSPSDFGFHNAILASDGRLRFIDFEYAGWDDPAKMVCDFFCQPAVPVPLGYYDTFVDRVVSELSEPETHLHRVALLLPVYRVKWSCIFLNEFLPVSSARRRFAHSAAEQEERKARQLEKARCTLQTVTE